MLRIVFMKLCIKVRKNFIYSRQKVIAKRKDAYFFGRSFRFLLPLKRSRKIAYMCVTKRYILRNRLLLNAESILKDKNI